jgi:hypothetical protein
MRLFLSTLLTALIVPFSAQSHSPNSCPAPESAPMRWQLVGFTSATTDGIAGPLGFTRLCDAEYPGSRWCTSREVLNSSNLPATSGEAWVRPTFEVKLLDASGLESSAPTLTCGSYSNPGGNSLKVDDAGRFLPGACSTLRAVACCALVP